MANSRTGQSTAVIAAAVVGAAVGKIITPYIIAREQVKANALATDIVGGTGLEWFLRVSVGALVSSLGPEILPPLALAVAAGWAAKKIYENRATIKEEIKVNAQYYGLWRPVKPEDPQVDRASAKPNLRNR